MIAPSVRWGPFVERPKTRLFDHPGFFMFLDLDFKVIEREREREKECGS